MVSEFDVLKRNIDIRDKYLVKENAPWPRSPMDKYEWRHNDPYRMGYTRNMEYDPDVNLFSPLPKGEIDKRIP